MFPVRSINRYHAKEKCVGIAFSSSFSHRKKGITHNSYDNLSNINSICHSQSTYQFAKNRTARYEKCVNVSANIHFIIATEKPKRSRNVFKHLHSITITIVVLDAFGWPLELRPLSPHWQWVHSGTIVSVRLQCCCCFFLLATQRNVYKLTWSQRLLNVIVHRAQFSFETEYNLNVKVLVEGNGNDD